MCAQRKVEVSTPSVPKAAQVRQRPRLRAVDAVSLSADGILGLNSDRRIQVFNPALEQLTGFKRKDVVGKECRNVLRVIDSHGDLLCGNECPLDHTESSRVKMEGELIGAHGKGVPVELHYAVKCTPTGELLGAVVNVREVTGVQQDSSVRSTLLALVSHELQTPISIIKAYASTLARADASWSEAIVREKLNAIEEESDRLSRLVSRLLYTSRLEANSITLNLMLLDLPLETQRVARRLAETDKDHEILVSFPADFPPVTGDPEKIDEVLTNLIENALKFSPEGGSVTIEGTFIDSEVHITVGDQGIGIPEGEEERIFERFYRVTNSGGTTPGTGLGLHICRLLINAHGGRVWVESHPSTGSRFTFTLPVASEA